MAAVTAARRLGCAPTEVVVASTGVIGVPLPMDKVRAGIADGGGRRLAASGGAAAARAILTTDTRPKEVAVELPLSGGTVHDRRAWPRARA